MTQHTLIKKREILTFMCLVFVVWIFMIGFLEEFPSSVMYGNWLFRARIYSYSLFTRNWLIKYWSSSSLLWREARAHVDLLFFSDDLHGLRETNLTGFPKVTKFALTDLALHTPLQHQNSKKHTEQLGGTSLKNSHLNCKKKFRSFRFQSSFSLG